MSEKVTPKCSLSVPGFGFLEVQGPDFKCLLPRHAASGGSNFSKMTSPEFQRSFRVHFWQLLRQKTPNDHRSEGTPNGIFCPWVRVVDWAWTLEETSSRPRRRRRHPGGVMLENPIIENPTTPPECGWTHKNLPFCVSDGRTEEIGFS